MSCSMPKVFVIIPIYKVEAFAVNQVYYGLLIRLKK